MWWLPEVQRQRATYDDHEADVVPRLSAAADLASRHGSIALLRRCQRDLAVRGVRPPAQAERLRAVRRSATRTLRERPGS